MHDTTVRSMRAVLGFLLVAAAVVGELAHQHEDAVVGGASSEQFSSFRGDASEEDARRLRTRIFGGAPAAAGTYPSFAIPRLSIFGGKLCGSVKIWDDILLSAGHCSGAFRGMDVLIGTNHLDGSTALESIRALSELVHPQFNRTRFLNDLMLIKLQRASAAPNMPWNADPLAPLNGESVQIIGFGRTELGIISSTLLEASVNIGDYESCRRAYGSWIRNDIMICASKLNTDACNGDSGGPMMVNGVVVGITSFGNGCANMTYPGVYARVSAATDFIRHGICQLSSYPPENCDEFSGTVAPVQLAADFLCFSSRSTVLAQGKGITRMDQLEMGDMVLAKDGTYTRVYSFGHLDRRRNHQFLRITTVGNHYEPLEITAGHLLFVDQVGLVPAGQVRVGDVLVTSEKDTNFGAKVLAVHKIYRNGMYAPFTVSGTIVVNGMATSNYIALPPAFQSTLSFDDQHWVQHAAFLPYRLFCGLVRCHGETHDPVTGLSQAVTFWLPLLHWLESRDGRLVHGILLLVTTVLNASNVVRLLVAVILGYYLTWKRRKQTGVKGHKS